MDLLRHRLAKFVTLGISLLLVQVGTAADAPKPLPRYTLDVRDAPTAAVFAMMLGGTEVTVMRHFPTFVSLRLTEKQVTLPPPDPGRGYGDYWPIGGWLGHMQKAMGVKGMILGFEREGGAFYASIDGKPPSNSYDFYRIMERGPNDCWHKVSPLAKGIAVPPPSDVSLSSFRLAGVRWTNEQPTRRAILVVRNKKNDAFTRVVQEGDQVGIEGLTVEKIEPSKVTLGRANGELVKLNLQRSR